MFELYADRLFYSVRMMYRAFFAGNLIACFVIKGMGVASACVFFDPASESRWRDHNFYRCFVLQDSLVDVTIELTASF